MMIGRMLTLVAAVAVLGVAAIAAEPMCPMMHREEPRTISVTGTAEMMVAPDLALVTLAVETQQPTVAAATQQNNAASTRVQQSITALNISNLTLRTLGFDVQPVYEQIPPNNTRPVTPRVVAYRVTNRIEVRMPDTDTVRLSTNVGRVLDAALTAGANRVDNLQFTLADPNAAMQPVIAQATRNARQTAMTVATAAGVTLGMARSLSTTPSMPGPRPYMMMASRAMEYDAAPPIEAGMLQLQAMVSAVYDIQ